MTWLTLPDTGTLLLLTDDGRPALMRLDPRDPYTGAQNAILEIEVVTNWRVDTRTLTSADDRDGWWLLVEWVGRLAVPCTYAEFKTAPTHPYPSSPTCDAGRLTGLAGVSVTNALAAEWRGHPAGSYLVWASHPGALGVVRRVGWESVLLRLAMDRLPEATPTPPAECPVCHRVGRVHLAHACSCGWVADVTP